MVNILVCQGESVQSDNLEISKVSWRFFLTQISKRFQVNPKSIEKVVCKCKNSSIECSLLDLKDLDDADELQIVVSATDSSDDQIIREDNPRVSCLCTRCSESDYHTFSDCIKLVCSTKRNSDCQGIFVMNKGDCSNKILIQLSSIFNIRSSEKFLIMYTADDNILSETSKGSDASIKHGPIVPYDQLFEVKLCNSVNGEMPQDIFPIYICLLYDVLFNASVFELFGRDSSSWLFGCLYKSDLQKILEYNNGFISIRNYLLSVKRLSLAIYVMTKSCDEARNEKDLPSSILAFFKLSLKSTLSYDSVASDSMVDEGHAITWKFNCESQNDLSRILSKPSFSVCAIDFEVYTKLFDTILTENVIQTKLSSDPYNGNFQVIQKDFAFDDSRREPPSPNAAATSPKPSINIHNPVTPTRPRFSVGSSQFLGSPRALEVDSPASASSGHKKPVFLQGNTAILTASGTMTISVRDTREVLIRCQGVDLPHEYVSIFLPSEENTLQQLNDRIMVALGLDPLKNELQIYFESSQERSLRDSDMEQLHDGTKLIVISTEKSKDDTVVNIEILTTNNQSIKLNVPASMSALEQLKWIRAETHLAPNAEIIHCDGTPIKRNDFIESGMILRLDNDYSKVIDNNNALRENQQELEEAEVLSETTLESVLQIPCLVYLNGLKYPYEMVITLPSTYFSWYEIVNDLILPWKNIMSARCKTLIYDGKNGIEYKNARQFVKAAQNAINDFTMFTVVLHPQDSIIVFLLLNNFDQMIRESQEEMIRFNGFQKPLNTLNLIDVYGGIPIVVRMEWAWDVCCDIFAEAISNSTLRYVCIIYLQCF